VTIDDRDDVEYWNALADRVAATAVRRAKIDAVGWLAQSRGAWLTTCLIALAALAFGAAYKAADAQKVDWAAAVVPSDAIGRAVALNPQPPAVGALLVGPQSRGRR
jgi:hypothetical protein